jgi:hypothetical protein
MKKDDDDKPVVEATGKGLGVRGEPVNEQTDVDLDPQGRVLLNRKGMSVAPQWRDLPFFLISKRLRDKVPSARGNSNLYCFTMGDGPFEEGALSQELTLIVDRATHGVVTPQTLVSLNDFQSHLADTRDDWWIDEV